MLNSVSAASNFPLYKTLTTNTIKLITAQNNIQKDKFVNF